MENAIRKTREKTSVLEWATNSDNWAKQWWSWVPCPVNVQNGRDVADLETVQVVVRVSTKGQAKNQNQAYQINRLTEFCKENGIKPVEQHVFFASGKLEHLYRYFRRLQWDDASIFQMPYFDGLEMVIREVLHKTKAGEKIHVLLYSIDRLFRTKRFDTGDPNTWKSSNGDWEIFTSWLSHCFGDRAGDIVFVTVYDQTPKEIRGLQSKAGMEQRNNMGGRPTKQEGQEKRKKKVKCQPGDMKKRRDKLLPVIAMLDEEGLDAKQIYDHIRNALHEGISERTFRHWMQITGLSRKRGRPPKDQFWASSKNGKFSHPRKSCNLTCLVEKN